MRAFEQCKLGRKGVDDGVLLVVAKDDRRVRIEPGYGLEGAIPDAIANRVIQEYLVPKFRADDYGGGMTDATAALVKLIDGEPLPAPMADNAPAREGGGGDWLFALFAAFIVAQVARGIFGVRARRAARDRQRRRGGRHRLAARRRCSGRGRHRCGHRLVHRAGGQRARRPLRAPRRLGRHAGGGGGAGAAVASAAVAAAGRGGGGMSGGGGASGSW